MARRKWKQTEAAKRKIREKRIAWWAKKKEAENMMTITPPLRTKNYEANTYEVVVAWLMSLDSDKLIGDIGMRDLQLLREKLK